MVNNKSQFYRSKNNSSLRLAMLTFMMLFFVTGSFAQDRITTTFITTSFEKANLSEVIRKIENNTDFKFVYQSDLLTQKDKSGTLTLAHKKWSVGEILVELGKIYDLGFKQVSNNITIKDNRDESSNDQGEPILIMGVITDDLGDALPGVAILEVGTLNGEITDFDGEYTIKASSNGVLEFSFLGFITKRINIDNRTDISFQMVPDNTVLSEVVITGYQTLSSEVATGSYGVIKEDQIQNQIEENLTDRLNGLTTGLVVDKNPDGTEEVIIRGQSTFSSNRQPLIVVDGLPIEGGWESIEPNDVKSINVLKDASASSIWGTRASNGVIVIETKSASTVAGRSRVTVGFNTTIGEMSNISDLQLANSSDLVDFEFYANLKGAVSPIDLARNHFAISPVTQLLLDNPPDISQQLDYLKTLDHTSQIEDNLMRNSVLYQANVFLQNTSDRNMFSVSFNGKSNQTNMVGTGNKQFNINLKNEFKIIEKLKFNIGINANYRVDEFNGISGGTISGRKPYELLLGVNGEHLAQSFTWHQRYIDQFQERGYLNWNYNLIDEVGNADNTVSALNTRINASFVYQPITGLNITASFLFENGDRQSRNLQSEGVYSTANMINQYTLLDPTTGLLNLQFPRGSINRVATNPYNSYTIRALASYNRAFFDNDLKMDVLGGYEIREYTASSRSDAYVGFDDQGLEYSNLYLQGFVEKFDGSTSSVFPTSTFDSNFTWDRDRHISYFGNFNFTYKNRYTLTASARIDKASLFGVDQRFKNNPLWSVGGKWNIMKEEFGPDFFDRLEFRVSYGFTGNINKDFASYATAVYGTNPLTQVQFLKLKTPKNDDLSFEKTAIFNAGIDFALKNNILGGSIEVFTKNSQDLLGQFPNDPTTGWSFINSNYANMSNKGLEVGLNSTMIKTENITWSAGINFSTVKNEVTNVVNQLTGARYYIYGGTGAAKEGFPISALYNFQYAGLNQYGNYLYRTADGGIVEGRDSGTLLFEDLVYSGQTTPKYYGGFNTIVSYKGLSLNLLLTYKAGYVSRLPMLDYNAAAFTGNTHETIANVWTRPGDELKDGVLPAYYNEETDVINSLDNSWRNNAFANDARYFDASHIRFKNVRLSYDTVFGGKKQFNIQVYGLVQNLAVFTKNNLGIDPDYINPYTGALRFTEPRNYALGFNIQL